VKAQIQSLRDGDPKKFQGWTLKGLLGEGGQSTIYLAEKNGQIAALKIIRKEYLHDEKAVDRFFTEIKNLELLDHPNIAKVLEVEDSGKFIAIEYIQGLNLEDYVAESGPLPIEEWWNFALSLTKTVEYCHSKGIIHKDISPKNIIAGPKGPVLIDFGISYFEKDPRLTSKEETIGTPPFMSPEHFGIARPKEMDNFSLAGTLIFAATGHYPFSGETKAEWRESILFDLPDFIGLSEDQIKLLSPLLYKKPEHRGSLDTFSKLLREVIASETQSDFVIKEFAKVNRESQNKLVQEKKKLKVKNQSIKKVIASAAVISLISIGAVAYGIIAIQNNSRDGAKNATVSIDKAEVTSTEPNAILGADTQKDNSPINKEIQANLDLAKKFYNSNQLDKALVYAKLAANAGNAHGMYDVGLIFADQNKSQEAVKWYEKAANLGYGDAFWNLGGLYEKLGQIDTALSWYEKGAKNNNVGSINALGFYFGDKKEDHSKAIAYFQKSADLGSVLGMSNLGFEYEQINDKVKAKKWYTTASDLGSVDASVNLGYMYEQTADWTNARKYYKRAADKKDPMGMYNLAIVLGNYFGQGDQGCVLLKEAILIKSIEPDTKKLANAAIAKGCSATPGNENLIPSAAKASDGNLQPVATYKSSEYSEKLATNVKSSSIFGRAYLSDLNWKIPLTNSANESVPPINRVQFRDASLPYGSWWNMPYDLINSGNVGWQAVVSNLGIQLLHSSGKKVCPEFRFALVQNGLVTYIWTKSVEPCTAPE
jgi:serine/threonine protein kinase